jgi:hypothetical protein
MRWLVVAALVIGVGGTGCESSRSCDMSTDKGAQAAYQKLTGKKSKEPCVRRFDAFPGLARVGSHYAPDAGCIEEIWIWRCEETTFDNTAEILQSVGWKTTDDPGREKIAGEWLAIDSEVLFTADADATAAFAKAGKTFTPATITSKDGGVVATGWYRTSRTNIGGKLVTYHQLATSFGEDGSVTHPDDPAETFYGR